VLDDESLSLAIRRVPSLLGLNMETNAVEPTLEWHGQSLVLDDESLNLTMQRMPQSLGSNVETNEEQSQRGLERRLCWTTRLQAW
jgi:hypothetical protein